MPFVYTWAGDTHAGRTREHNEDAFYPQGSGSGPGPLILVVADGLGGLNAGEVASRLAVEAASRPAVSGLVSVVDRLRAAERAVLRQAGGDNANMATTLTLAELSEDGRMGVAHCGDSRLYVLGDSLVQVTTDQTVTQRKLMAGEITPAQARTDPDRHVLTSACGAPNLTVQHVAGIRLEPGDRILLCSDGLTEMLDDEAITAIMTNGSPPALTVRALIEAANRAGGVDNITAVVVDVGEPEPGRDRALRAGGDLPGG